MSAQSLLNSANAKFKGNIVLENGYLKFPDGSIQTTSGGGGSSLIGETSTNNTYLGVNAGLNATGSQNTAIGSNSSEGLTTGSFNTSLGFGSLLLCHTGNANTAIGEGALSDCLGSNNTAVGNVSLNNLTTGNYNIALGQNSGLNLTGNSSNNTFIGYNSTQLNTDPTQYEYLTLIGANSTPIAIGQNNQLVLGSTTGNETIYIPTGNSYLGDDLSDSNYNLEISGANSALTITTYSASGNARQAIRILDQGININLNPISIGNIANTNVNYQLQVLGSGSGLNITTDGGSVQINSEEIMTTFYFRTGTGTMDGVLESPIIYFTPSFTNLPIITCTYLGDTVPTRPLSIAQSSPSSFRVIGDANASFNWIAFSLTG